MYIPVVVTFLQPFTPNELTSRRFRIEYHLVVVRRLRRSPVVFSLVGLSPFPSRRSPWPGFYISNRVRRTLGNTTFSYHPEDAVIALRNFDSTLAYFISSLRSSRSFFRYLLYLRLHLPSPEASASSVSLSAMYAAIATPPSRGDIAVVVIQGEGAVIASFRRLRTFRHARRSSSIQRVFLDCFLRSLSSS